MNLDTSIRDILEAQKLLPLLPPVLVPPHPEAATSGTIQFQPNWRGDASLTPAEQAVKKQRNDAATLYWARQNIENAGRAEREAAAAKAREQEEAEWVKASTREHTKKPKRTDEGVFDIFSKKKRVINALIKGRTAQRDAADTQSDQLGLSMNTYLNHRDASRRADDSIEKNKVRLAGGRGRDYTDGMNAGALEWFKKEKKKGKKKKKQTNEETLHELDKKTLHRYIPKAEGDKRFSRFASQSPNDISSDEKRKWARRASKRSKGIALAGEKLVAEETLQELDKGTIKSFIEKRRKQAEIAAANSQTAKKAWLGNSRETGWRDPIVPRVVGQIGKIGQHDPALLQTAAIFNQRSERAKESVRKAKLRLITQSGKKEKTMQNEEVKIDKQRNGRPFPETRFPGWKVGNNMLTQKRATKGALTPAQKANGLKKEEYTQVLEQMILTLTGMELKELHEAVGGHLSEDYQTPARNAQMQDMYDRAEGKFFNNLSSDELLRKVRAIDNKNNAEQQSPRLYGKNGKIIPQTNKKRVRVGQPGGKQGGYQG